jgi:NAD-dependent SIR2 family protein deacetylase
MKEAYIHSKCCNVHWELCYKDGIFDLRCEKCGKPIRSGIVVFGPSLEHKECESCKGK